MYQQTINLANSLPTFAPYIKAADRKGGSYWEIVRWTSIEPHDVNPAEVRPISKDELNGESERNQFDSRTKALRASERITRAHRQVRSERGHWGVWRWTENGQTHFQTVVPLNRPGANGVAPKPPLEPGTSGSGSMVRLGDRAYRMLRRRAGEEKMSLQATLEAAIDHYDRHRFFDQLNESYERVKANPQEWAELMAEREEWDVTLLDGIEPDDYSSEVAANSTELQERKSA